jgi:hypothetical protein
LNRIGFIFRSVVCAALFSAVAASAQLPAYTEVGPVPPAILSAKRVFVSNAGSGSGFFPERFSGDPNRAYTQFYAALKAANQFALATDPSDADLVLEVQLNAPVAPVMVEGRAGDFAVAPEFFFRLVIYDRKTHWILWTINQGIGWADLQKNRDRRFDGAIIVLMEKFQQLAGKPITPFH